MLACTHFPLVEAELAAAAPRSRSRFVDGKEGIARRTAWLTRGPDLARAPRPKASPSSPAGSADVDAYRAGLARFGLTRVETL